MILPHRVRGNSIARKFRKRVSKGPLSGEPPRTFFFFFKEMAEEKKKKKPLILHFDAVLPTCASSAADKEFISHCKVTFACLRYTKNLILVSSVITLLPKGAHNCVIKAPLAHKRDSNLQGKIFIWKNVPFGSLSADKSTST